MFLIRDPQGSPSGPGSSVQGGEGPEGRRMGAGCRGGDSGLCGGKQGAGAVGGYVGGLMVSLWDSNPQVKLGWVLGGGCAAGGAQAAGSLTWGTLQGLWPPRGDLGS